MASGFALSYCPHAHTHADTQVPVSSGAACRALCRPLLLAFSHLGFRALALRAALLRLKIYSNYVKTLFCAAHVPCLRQ